MEMLHVADFRNLELPEAMNQAQCMRMFHLACFVWRVAAARHCPHKRMCTPKVRIQNAVLLVGH